MLDSFNEWKLELYSFYDMQSLFLSNESVNSVDLPSINLLYYCSSLYYVQNLLVVARALTVALDVSQTQIS